MRHHVQVVELALELARNKVAVRVKGDLDARMPELLTHIAHVVAPVEPDAGVAVPEVVHSDPSELRPFEALL